MTIAWNGTTGKGSTSQTRNIYTVVPKSMCSDGTLLACWDYLAWAFNALLAGRIPERDHRGIRHPKAGKRIAGGWTFAVVQVRGDWEWYASDLGLPRWDNVPSMCWLCRAQQGDGVAEEMKWTSVAEGGWRLQVGVNFDSARVGSVKGYKTY